MLTFRTVKHDQTFMQVEHWQPTRAGLDYIAFLCQDDQLVSRELKLTESIIFKDFVIYQEKSMFKSSKTFRRLQVKRLQNLFIGSLNFSGPKGFF